MFIIDFPRILEQNLSQFLKYHLESFWNISETGYSLSMERFMMIYIFSQS